MLSETLARAKGRNDTVVVALHGHRVIFVASTQPVLESVHLQLLVNITVHNYQLRVGFPVGAAH